VDQETSPSETVRVEGPPVAGHVLVVRGIRRLLLAAVIVALVCRVLLTASKAGCADEFGGCYDIRMSASPALFFGFAVIVFFSLDRIINRKLDAVAAARVLRRAGYVALIVAAVAVIVSHLWFWAIPMDGFRVNGWNIISPFPFAVIELTTTPAG
jgi:hypothetical protein